MSIYCALILEPAALGRWATVPSSRSGKLSLASEVESLVGLLARGDPAPPLPALEIASPSVGLVQTTELAENWLGELLF